MRKTTAINGSATAVSGKWACGVLCGVKPQQWEPELRSVQVLLLFKEERGEAGTARRETAKQVMTVWKCWLEACGWDGLGFGNFWEKCSGLFLFFFFLKYNWRGQWQNRELLKLKPCRIVGWKCSSAAGNALHSIRWQYQNVSDKMSVGQSKFAIYCKSTSCYLLASDCNYGGATCKLCIIQLSHEV